MKKQSSKPKCDPVVESAMKLVNQKKIRLHQAISEVLGAGKTPKGKK